MQHLSAEDVNRVIEMAWEDRTPFDAIKRQFGLSEAEVIKLMRNNLLRKNWKKWRARVQGRSTKHEVKMAEGVTRFRSKAQRAITLNRISKKKY